MSRSHDDAARLKEIAATLKAHAIWPDMRAEERDLRSIAARLEAAPAVRVPDAVRAAARYLAEGGALDATHPAVRDGDVAAWVGRWLLRH